MYEWYKCQNHSYKFWCWSVMRCWHSEMCWHSEASNIGLAINLHHRPYNTLAPPCKCGTKRSCQIDRHSLLISHNQVVCIPFHSTHTHVKMRMPLPNCSMVMYWYRLAPAACRICLHSSRWLRPFCEVCWTTKLHSPPDLSPDCLAVWVPGMKCEESFVYYNFILVSDIDCSNAK